MPKDESPQAAPDCADENPARRRRLSVIVPALNEADSLSATLARVRSDPAAEVIVVDGGSRDETAAIARQAGARCVNSRPGRAVQMNAGAAEARGETLLFLHADTLLPPDYRQQAERVLGQEGVVAGAFRLAFDDRRLSLRLIAAAANLRSRFRQLPYGDQVLFLRRETFAALGGFRELPVMEDYDLVRRLRTRGRVALAPAYVTTSARRWLHNGIWRTTLTHQRMLWGWKLGLSPDRLLRWRTRGRRKGSASTEDPSRDRNDSL